MKQSRRKLAHCPSVFILGVRIDAISRREAIEKVRSFLDEGQHTIFTPNPEMLVDAAHDTAFRDALNRGSLNLCDGKGITLFSSELMERIPGIDFMLDVCRVAEENGTRVYLLGSLDLDILAKAKEALLSLFPALEIAGYSLGPVFTRAPDHCAANNATLHFRHSGVQVGEQAMEQWNNAEFQKQNHLVVENIVKTSPEILFVAFGHGKQEWWIQKYLDELPSIKIAMGVGGAFDMLSGRLRRAPVLFRRLGIEWVWRLLQEPRRAGRIWKATATFPFLCFKEYLSE